MSLTQQTVAVRKTLLSNFVKSEFGLEHFYERDVRALTVTGDEEIGAVFASDGTILLAADVAGLTGDDNLSMLVDDCIYTDGAGAGTRDFAVLTGGVGASGSAIVVREQLKFGDALSAGQIDSVVASIEAQGIKVATQV